MFAYFNALNNILTIIFLSAVSIPWVLKFATKNENRFINTFFILKDVFRQGILHVKIKQREVTIFPAKFLNSVYFGRNTLELQ